MYNAIIAEDSKPILRNLQMLIRSAGLPVQVTATASNGLEALEHLKSRPADILLTDIRMPKLDGLGLIEQAKKLNPRLQTVLISGYSDFEYARRALNLQAFDYLLKPVDQGQLVDVLSRLLEQLREQQENERRLLEGVVEADYLAEMTLDTELLAGEKRLMLVRQRPFATESKFWDIESIAAALKDFFNIEAFRVLPSQQAGQFVIMMDEGVFIERNDAGILKESFAERLRFDEASVVEALKNAGLSAVALAAAQHVELRTLSAAYGKLERTVRDRLTVSGCLASSLTGEQEVGASEAAKLAIQVQLAELIVQRQKERFLLLLRQSLPYWLHASARMMSLERLVIFLTDEFGVGRQESAIETSGEKVPDAVNSEPEFRTLFAAASPEVFAESLYEWCAAKFDRLQEPGKRGGEELFEQIDRHLRQNLYAQISIAEAAQQFHVSPSYISRIIKRYTGSTFVHHYMELKIDEARRLLASEPDMKVKHVSDALGFGDPHYFSKVFKEYAGCSPTEYKDKLA
ncbi:response regulator [Saccharibacillus sacchari]|uniref:response regulator n=1 Tax=Saccharibacillus sacchari TaxID=456493 RepID=UPI0004B77EAE|nr:response regulator [Saccharibacillus sacchari]